jgi:Uma2 family endonuclease
MVAQPNRSLKSVEDYLALDRSSFETRYEFIDGHVYMLAGGTLDHSTIKINITSLLRSLIHGGPCRVYDSDARVRLSQKRYVYPDVSVSCDSRDRGTIDTVQYPCLIIEVLSTSTEAYDRGKKFSYYRACPTIEEYVLVDTQQQSVEVYRREQDFWKLYPFGPGDQVVLASLGVRFPIAAIYEDVTLPEEEDTSNNSSN